MKDFIFQILKGFNGINLSPKTDYSALFEKDPEVMAARAWEKTGKLMQETLNSYGLRIRQEDARQRIGASARQQQCSPARDRKVAC